MEAIYEDREYDENDLSESVQNILTRYDIFKACYPAGPERKNPCLFLLIG
jgi:hypothetical protein